MKKEISAAEWRAYNRGILQEYLIHTRLEPGERRELFRWVNSGHRVHGDYTTAIPTIRLISYRHTGSTCRNRKETVQPPDEGNIRTAYRDVKNSLPFHVKSAYRSMKKSA